MRDWHYSKGTSEETITSVSCEESKFLKVQPLGECIQEKLSIEEVKMLDFEIF